jgi:Tol biopolymer transport system component
MIALSKWWSLAVFMPALLLAFCLSVEHVGLVQQAPPIAARPDLIAFARTHDGAHSICVLGLDGREPRILYSSKTEELGTPVVCTDQGFVVFASLDNRLYRVALDGTGYRFLTAFPKGDRWLAYDVSRDGRQMVVALCASGDEDGLYVVDTQSGQSTRLNSEDCFHPCFSPDGKRIAFESSRDGHYQIFAMDLAGQNRIKLSAHEQDTAYGARWSPDGTLVAFQDSNTDLLVANATTGKCRRVARLDAFSYAFSPDSRRVAYRSEGAICTAAADGGAAVTLAQAPLDVRIIAWSSDGKTVIFDQWATTPEDSALTRFIAVDVENKTERVLKQW